jgi:hypothetical protein
MKTAILISGQVRDARECFPTLRDHIINPYNADVFIETWIPDNNVLDHRGQLISNNLSSDEVLTMYKPKMARFEDFDNSPLIENIKSLNIQARTAYDGSSAWETKIHNVFFMYYKVWRCFNLMEEYEKVNSVVYDRVFRMRFDLKFDSFPIIEPAEQTVYVPAGFDHRGGINDLLSFGDRKTMQKVCDLFRNLLSYSSQGIGLHPESVLRRHYEIQNLNVQRFDIKYKLRGEYV